LGLEHRLLPAALLFFNVGVEIGQLAFVLLVLALIWAHRRLDAVLPRWGDALPAYAIGAVSMFWFLGRLFARPFHHMTGNGRTMSFRVFPRLVIALAALALAQPVFAHEQIGMNRRARQRAAASADRDGSFDCDGRGRDLGRAAWGAGNLGVADHVSRW